MKPLVEVRNISKFFPVTGGLLHRKIGEIKAVNDVSFSISGGEIVGVVGESGCGKSTLARLVLGLVKPSRGKILFDGEDIGGLSNARLRKLRRRMQMVFQDPHSALDPRNSIFRSMEEVFKIQKEKMSRENLTGRIFELLEMVGLTSENCRAYPHQLSGGQKQRAVIARALAMEPDLLILDEPTAALDVSVQAQITLLLQRLGKRFKMSYMFISHDLSLVDYFCERIVVMYLGRIVEVTPGKLSGHSPCHPYTKLLMDSIFTTDPNIERKSFKIEGDVPTPFNLPKGCVFESRCDFVQDICRSQSPPIRESRSGGLVACHLPFMGRGIERKRIYDSRVNE